MDCRLTYCLVLLGVIVAIPCICSQAASTTIATAGAAVTTTAKAPAPTGNSGKQGNVPGGLSSTAAAATTQKPKKCVSGKCVGSNDDESCVRGIKGTCQFIGSCTKTVTKNQTHSTFTLGCGQATCPTNAPVTTTKAAGAAAPPPATTTTTTCCTDDLCNQFQPKSAAVVLTSSVFYLIGSFALLAALV